MTNTTLIIRYFILLYIITITPKTKDKEKFQLHKS